MYKNQSEKPKIFWLKLEPTVLVQISGSTIATLCYLQTPSHCLQKWNRTYQTAKGQGKALSASTLSCHF